MVGTKINLSEVTIGVFVIVVNVVTLEYTVVVRPIILPLLLLSLFLMLFLFCI